MSAQRLAVSVERPVPAAQLLPDFPPLGAGFNRSAAGWAHSHGVLAGRTGGIILLRLGAT
jgi:hypothetical protein